MKTHGKIDRRSLQMARAIAEKLESGSVQAGLEKARAVNRRWRRRMPTRFHEDWAEILQQGWPVIRAALLDPSERGVQLRQNSPFCGILTAQERWAFYRKRKP
ncbi:MAG TPA: hypothetical protein PK689_00365 [Kiritimatiellia bacterium]|jgi:hypothetical protein|nr:hypothetical protein [Kiritimatiellia bacterium]MDD4118383.1 hypothetical protein [Kiritimatiellia bacterium]NCC92546.1 hypothetical protein [Opitutae bacterium]HPC57429.1 hypothetical protein [Kiritimatiellia bacterium]